MGMEREREVWDRIEVGVGGRCWELWMDGMADEGMDGGV